jgi:Family of unknown function (DUF6941)
MAEVDFMALCDYARSERGLVHIIAAGIDRIQPPQLPAAQNLAVALRLALTREECTEEHSIAFLFRSPDGAVITELRARFRTDYPEGNPDGWPAFVVLSPSFVIPIEQYGTHSVEVLLDDVSQKTVEVLVTRPQEG